MRSRKVFACFTLVLLMSVKSTIAVGQQPDPCPLRKGREQPALEYRAQGGLTGGSQIWLIYSDGLVCRSGDVRLPSSRESANIPRSEVTALLDEIATIGFFGMPKGRKCSGACFQCYSYRITVRRGGNRKTVEGCDTAMAPGLKSIISKIQHALANTTP